MNVEQNGQALPTFADHFINALRQRRERLHDELAELEAHHRVALQENELLKKQLEAVTAQRDEYRKAFDALVPKMQPVQPAADQPAGEPAAEPKAGEA
jgi:chromosome segregation ATPase